MQLQMNNATASRLPTSAATQFRPRSRFAKAHIRTIYWMGPGMGHLRVWATISVDLSQLYIVAVLAITNNVVEMQL